MNGPISDLDRDRMPNEITLACKGLLKLAKQDLRVVAGMSVQIANELRNLYLELRPILPIIVALKNPDLQPRHWDIINKIKEGFVVDYDLHQSINDLVRLKVLDILEEIAAVSDIATKEKQLENQLSKMRAEWHTMKF
jgi:dynein heavy chain